MLPGVGHCRGGPGGGDFDWLTAIENWVEKGQAPDHIIAMKQRVEPYPTIQTAAGETIVLLPRYPLAADAIVSARPVFAYPDVASWTGQGDPARPENWVKAKR